MKKVLKYLYFAVCFALILALPCFAYIDPTIMTYGIQIIAAVAVTVGAVVGILWRKAKKKVQDKLGIDENAKKEVEDEIEFDDDDE